MRWESRQANQTSEKKAPRSYRDLVVNQADVQESDDMINDALGGEGCGGSFKMAG